MNHTSLKILSNQILRLARIYGSKPICAANIDWHNRVIALQASRIQEKKQIIKKLRGVKKEKPWTYDRMAEHAAAKLGVTKEEAYRFGVHKLLTFIDQP